MTMRDRNLEVLYYIENDEKAQRELDDILANVDIYTDAGLGMKIRQLFDTIQCRKADEEVDLRRNRAGWDD